MATVVWTGPSPAALVSAIGGEIVTAPSNTYSTGDLDGVAGYVFYAQGLHSTLNSANATLIANGDQTAAALALAQGTINLSHVAVMIGGTGSTGLVAVNIPGIGPGGGTIQARDFSIAVSGANSVGAVSQQHGSTLLLSNSTITTTGNGDTGLAVIDQGQATLQNSTIETRGRMSTGVLTQTGGIATLGGLQITTGGPMSTGIAARSGSTVNATGVTVTTSGTGSVGVMSAGQGTTVNLSGATINVGDSGTGLSAAGGKMNAGETGVNATAPNSVGLASSAGGLLSYTNSAVSMTHDNSVGLNVAQQGHATVTGSTIQTAGGNSPGISMNHGGTVSLVNTQVRATGVFSDALVTSGGTPASPSIVSLDNSVLDSTQSSTIRTTGDVVTITMGNGSEAIGGTGGLLSVVSGAGSTASAVNLTASQSRLSGNVIAAAGNIANVTLAVNSQWVGAAQQVNALTIDNSQWSVTGSSSMASLTVWNGGTVLFVAPTLGGAFKTLTTGTLRDALHKRKSSVLGRLTGS